MIFKPTYRATKECLQSMSSVAVESAVASPVNPRSRVILASLIGTTVEFYDFYVYATAAVLVFPRLFFPAGDDRAALLASFAVFGAAMIARPLGAIFFRHLGDKKGRKITLVGALLTMGIATFLIGLLPTYPVVGWLAPALLVVLRLAQGLRWAANGAVRLWWPRKTLRKASARSLGRFRNLARHLDSSSPTGFS
jgi:MFS family permease